MPTNTAQSSIAYSHRWPDSPFSLTSNVSAKSEFFNNSVTVRMPFGEFQYGKTISLQESQEGGQLNGMKILRSVTLQT
jgi:hypothetical protein